MTNPQRCDNLLILIFIVAGNQTLLLLNYLLISITLKNGTAHFLQQPPACAKLYVYLRIHENGFPLKFIHANSLT